jgi:hypothetical protein
MPTVWEATTPRSEALGELRSGEQTTMKTWLEKADHLLPSFVNLVSQVDGKTGSPGELDLRITDTNEKAYQRAFFRPKPTEVSGSSSGTIKIDWLDIEVPVVGGAAPRRPCLDMIGAVDGKPCLIAELKDEGGKSPFYAVQEVLSYACRARDNHLTLTSHSSWTSDNGHGVIDEYWRHYEGKYLIVGGPDGYWKTWIAQWNLIVAVGSKWLVDSGLVGHRLLFVSFPEIDFLEQKPTDDKYTPSVPGSATWTVLFEAHANAEVR